MAFDLQRILESKRAHRQHLASRPIGEKLRLLDTLRERELAIRGRAIPVESASTIVREERKALLLVTHNPLIAEACDWIHEMRDGVIVGSHPRGSSARGSR